MNLPACTMICPYEGMTDEQWHEIRRGGIGGSDAGAILGYSKYASPLSVWMLKTGRMKPDQDAGEAAEVGTLLEKPIRETMVKPFIKEKLNLDVDVIDPDGIYQSNDSPHMLMNPDGFIRMETGRIFGLEIKTGSSYMLKEWGGVDGDEVPDSYYAQVQHYLAVSGLDEWWIFGLIGNRRLIRIVPRHESFINALRESVDNFWQLVAKNDPLYAPLPSGLESDIEALHILGNPKNETVAILDDIDDIIEEYANIRVEIQDKEELREYYRQRIIMKLGTSELGTSGAHEVRYKPINVPRLDTDRLKKERPEIYAAYAKTTEQWRLHVKNL